MANFGQLLLTNIGLNEQYKAQSGTPLKFKRIGMGSGTFSGNISALTGLVNQNVSVAISKGYKQNGAFVVEGFFSNDGLTTGFAWREIGLFCEDEDGNEVLYCYANAGDSYDYIPATGDERYSKYIRIATAIGNATNVSIVESEGILYVDTVTFGKVADKVESLYPTKIANGAVVSISDSADTPFAGLNIYGKSTQIQTDGKQLIPHPYHDSTITASGITFTPNDDGSVTVSGTATANAYFTLNGGFSSAQKAIPEWLTEGGTFTISGGNKSSVGVCLYLYKSTGETVSFNAYASSNTFTVPSGYDYYGLFIQVVGGNTVNTKIYPMLNEGKSALDFEIYTGGAPSPSPEYPQEIVNIGDDGSVSVGVYSGNLIPYPYNGLTNDTTEVDWTVNADRSISVSGTPTAQRYYAVLLQYKLPKGFYTLSGCPSGGSYQKYWMYVQRKSDGYVWYETGNGVTFEVTEEGLFDIAVNVGANAGTISNLTFRPMLNYGKEALAYQNYAKQSLSISTPNGLAGIPVSSGGNYTDANGQQWICDEIDLLRGVKVQRIKTITIGSLETPTLYNVTQGNLFRFSVSDIKRVEHASEKPSLLCNSYICTSTEARANFTISMAVQYNAIDFLNNNYTNADEFKEAMNAVKVAYVLATPIETALTDEEIATYKSLVSHSPITTVWNDAGADIDVEYVTATHDSLVSMLIKRIKDLETAMGNVNAVLEEVNGGA